ncbi:hypothetical protein QJQ45_004087 [Haematococcus lacustris]|nr:hypothetical protein QJQ45_004087 [Haematococcus lacustris]
MICRMRCRGRGAGTSYWPFRARAGGGGTPSAGPEGDATGKVWVSCYWVIHYIKLDSRVLHGVCKQLGLTNDTNAAFTSEPALSHHWARWLNTGKLRNKEFAFERTVDTDGVSVCVHYTRPLPPPPAPPPAASSNSRPSAAAAEAHAVGLPHIGKGIAETREFVFDRATQHLAAASSAGTSLDANLEHITVTLATWDAVLEVYLSPKWARQRLRLHGAQDRALEQFFKKLEEDMAEVSMERHGRAKQLVVFFRAARCSAVNGKQPCEEELDHDQPTGLAGWKPPAGQVDLRLLLPAWSQQREQPVRGMMWCPVVAPRKPPQPPCSSQEATQPASSEPGPSSPPPAKRSKRTKAEQAAEPTQPVKGKATKAKPAPQPGRWLDRDCTAALNMQHIAESRWRPLELCYWPEQGALPTKGKEYPGLGYKRLRDKPSKAQQQQQQPAEAL